MARIRTVKPSFWSHPITGKLSDAAKCMAIALLNLADDAGYFYADPATVRSFCRPFDDDSTITRGVLAELSRTRYIQIAEHPERGPVGRIINFLEHQKIDRPKPSEIKPYFIDDDSTKPRRLFDAGREGNGREEVREIPPDSDDQVFRIAKAYPSLDHILDDSEIPQATQTAIIQAIEKDGFDVVLRGTLAYAQSITDPTYTKDHYKFFTQFVYRRNHDAKPVGKFTQLLSTVSEPYSEPGEQFGTSRDR